MTTTSTWRPQQGAPSWLPSGRRTRDRTGGPASVAAYVSALRSVTDPDVRLQHGVSLLPALVPGCDHASVTTARCGQLRVRASSSDTGWRADERQDELDDGPCVQALRTGHSVIGHDLRTERRWPGWCRTAVDELDLTSALSVLLPARRPSGTLNLYSATHAGLSRVDLGLLHALAAPLSVALTEVRVGLRRLGPAA